MNNRFVAGIVLLLIAIIILSVSASRVVAQVLPNTFTNPITSGADPYMVFNNGFYYYLETSGGGITIHKTKSPVDIDNAVVKQVWIAPAGTAYCCNVWAPELHLINGRWYIYFSANDGTSKHSMYVLESVASDPHGDYILKGKLIAPNRKGEHAIDETVFRHSDGKLYLLYSGSWGGVSPQYIFIAPMSNPWTINGNAVELTRPEYSWEYSTSPINEGPVILQRNGKTFIVYSANAYASPDYALGMLTFKSGTVLSKSNWIKSSTPVFKKTSEVFAPGHNTFTKSPDNTEDWIIYHARDDAGSGRRTVRAQKFTWSADGLPLFGSPIASGVQLALPSGDSYGDLIMKDFVLTDKYGVVRNSFALGERIYPKLTIRNNGFRSVYVGDGETRSHFYSDAPSAVSVGTFSDVRVYMVNGQFGGGYEKTYGASPVGPNNSVFVGDYWVQSIPGSYTARVYLNFDKDGIEGNYDNNQATYTYTAGDVSDGSTPTPTHTPTPTPTPTPTHTPTPTPTLTPTVVNGPDLTVIDMVLTNANGDVKTSFKVNEPIYVKVLLRNNGNETGQSSDKFTYSAFYRAAKSPVEYNTPSRPENFYLRNGEFGGGYQKEYGSYASHISQQYFTGIKYWTLGTPGTYVARIFFDYNNNVQETNETNNQYTVTYTVTN